MAEEKRSNMVTVHKFDYYLRYVTLLGVIYLIFYIGQWSSNAENRMFEDSVQRAKTIDHLNDVEKERYVTRREYETYIITTKEDIAEIKELLKNKNK